MTSRCTLCLAGAGLAATYCALAESSAFTCQGRLTVGGSVANGSYDLQFTLMDAATEGNTVGVVLTNRPLAVSNGLFTALLDFGPGAFDGSDRWLAIGVRPNGTSGPHVLLSPRHQATAAPYSLFASASAFAGSAAALTDGGAGLPKVHRTRHRPGKGQK